MDSVENIDSHLPLPRDWHQNFPADIVYTCGTTKLAMSLAQGKNWLPVGRSGRGIVGIFPQRRQLLLPTRQGNLLEINPPPPPTRPTPPQTTEPGSWAYGYWSLVCPQPLLMPKIIQWPGISQVRCSCNEGHVANIH